MELQIKNAPILQRLNPGKSRNELANNFNSINVPENLLQLYEWKDGTNIDNAVIGECWIFKMGSFISSQRATQCYQKNVGRDEFWNDSKFPIFESLGGDFYLIDINNKSSTYGLIFFHSVGAVDFNTMISK